MGGTVLVKIPKKSGGFREVIVQSPRVKSARRKLARELTERVKELDSEKVVKGFVPGESPVSNAKVHAGARYILEFDLKDFFDHCTTGLIEKGWLPPVPEKWLPAGEADKARKMASASVWEGVAKQGLSSSPAAANIAALPMDRDILLALPEGFKYTRYADDLTISGNDIEEMRKLKESIPQIAKRHGQEINERKTRMQCADYGRMVVTGVAVDKDGTVHMTRSARRIARAAAHNAKVDATRKKRMIALGFKAWGDFIEKGNAI